MKIVASVFIVILALGFAGSQTLADDRPDPPKPRSPDLEKGRQAIDAKDYRAAVDHLLKAAKDAPKDADVHNLLGYGYRHLGQFDKSMEHYQLALSLDPNHRGAHEYIGELYLQMDQLANAEKQLQALQKACPWFGRCSEHDDLKGAIERYKVKQKS